MSSIRVPERQAVFLSVAILLKLFYPFILTLCGLIILGRSTDFCLALWAKLVLAAVCTPLVHAVRLAYRNWRLNRQAAQMGAVWPPHLQGNAYIGSVDLLVDLMDRFETEYIG